jgi:hypothetical protein
MLKQLLPTAPILQFPEFSWPFIITIDVLRNAASCILSQGETGNYFPLAFASRTVNKAERNYSTTDQEKAAMKHFRLYVLQ